MNEEQERGRGVIAQRILDEQVYKDAWEFCETKLASEMFKIETKTDRAEQLRMAVIGARYARRQLENIMLTGKMAEEQIARKQKKIPD